MLAFALAALLALPAPGQLLVEAPPRGLALVAADGEVTRLGEWYDAALAGDGTRVAATRGRRLAALDARGKVLWTLRRRAPAQPDWSSDGARLAYRDGPTLRVVRADGRADRAVRPRPARAAAARTGAVTPPATLGFAGPRWRPGSPDQLAFADRDGAVHLVAGARTVWRSKPGPPIRPYGLQWSPDGTKLAAIAGSVVRVFDGATGRPLERLTTTAHRNHFQLGTYAGGDLTLVRHDFRRGISHVTRNATTIFKGRGRVSDIVASPDGAWLLLGRRGGDSWELKGPTTVTRRHVSRAFGAYPAPRAWR